MVFPSNYKMIKNWGKKIPENHTHYQPSSTSSRLICVEMSGLSTESLLSTTVRYLADVFILFLPPFLIILSHRPLIGSNWKIALAERK